MSDPTDVEPGPVQPLVGDEGGHPRPGGRHEQVADPAGKSMEQPADGAAAGPSAARKALGSVTVAVLCAILGFALVVQVRAENSSNALASDRPDDLVQILDGLQSRSDDLNAEIADLQATLSRLKGSGASSAEALAEADRQAQALGILTGTIPAVGPGVRIVITDPAHEVPPELLLDAIEELRNAGAEAFQVGPARIGVSSFFSGGGGQVSVDGTALKAPYTIEAIGDPATLAGALAIAGGVLDTVKRAGGTMTTTQLTTVRITALRAVSTPIYARPSGG